jgi:2,6-dihydroxypseudooxynicotine hydrolase
LRKRASGGTSIVPGSHEGPSRLEAAREPGLGQKERSPPIDERVAGAIAHWKPRFTANGVTPPDFERITAGLERWEDWCDAWSRAASKHETLGREALAGGRSRSAGAHLAQAAVYFHFAKFVFVDDLGQMKTAHARAVRCLNDALPHLDPPGERHEIPFDGAALVGVLRRPAAHGPAPAVVLIPGLDSTKEELGSTEALFLERGMATFSVDGPGQGEAEYDLAIRGDWEVPGAAIVDHLAAQPGIDPARIGLWGVSLGGYYAPRVATGVPVRACIALSGPYDFGAVWDGLPLLTRSAYRVRSKTATEQQARAHALTLSLEGRTQHISCPLQVVTGKLDRIIPWDQARRLVDEVEGAEWLLLEDGNHGCANVAYKHRYRSADWMRQRVAG